MTVKSTVRPITLRRRSTIRTVRVALWVCTSGLFLRVAPPLLGSESIEVGYRDFTYPSGTGGNGAPTGEKPESKLWWNDGYWWASMWSGGSNGAYHIYRLDVGSQTWIDTGVALDDRRDSRADALWDGSKLYVASHIFDGSGGPSTDPQERGRLYRYSYSSASKTYTPDEEFPVEITGGTSETLVLEKDAQGKLWVTYVEDATVMVNRSLSGDDDWGQPFALPFDEAEVGSDDVSSIITYNEHVGIMWSNQRSSRRMYFAVHAPGTPDTQWFLVRAYGPSGDDHINLKSMETDSDGNVYAVIKTSANAELIMLLVCERNVHRCRNESDWRSYLVYDGDYNPTRPILLIDTSNRELYVFTRNVDGGHQAIYYKKTGLDNIEFEVNDIGTPFIKSASDRRINDPTSTKQNINSTTGMAVLASDSSARAYFHNHISLSGSIPQYALTVGTVGQGQVNLDPPGGVYDAETEVTLTAVPAAGWQFSGWSGDLSGHENPVTLIMDGDRVVTATFVQEPPTQYALSVGVAGSGTVSLDPPGSAYEAGTLVTLTAVPDPGWRFDSWSGDLSGSENPADLVMDADKTVTASFVQEEPAIDIEISASSISVTVGSVVTYTYVVANTGEVTLNNVAIVDDRLGSIPLDKSTFAAGESAVVRVAYTATRTDLPGPLVNTATVSGTSLLGVQVSDNATVSVTVNALPITYYIPFVLGGSTQVATMPSFKQ